MKRNKIYNENCLDTMAKMPENFIHLTVTSPPYDNLRDYKGYSFDFKSIAKELYRTTKEGGVVVCIVGDATVKGSETGTSFKQALFFKECGFNLHDTMIYDKGGVGGAKGSNLAYWNGFEYMFVFTKGKIKTFNPINDRKNPSFGRTVSVNSRKKDGTSGSVRTVTIKEFGKRFNLWTIKDGKRQKKHPAVFPDKLANDHIISWSNEGDIVYDPFMGSGTTAKMAIINKRNWIGSEISSEYCEIIKERLSEPPQTSLGF